MMTAPEGAPALVSIGDHGPLFGLVFVVEVSIEDLSLDATGLDTRPGMLRSWRVEIPAVPQRFDGLVRDLTSLMGPPSEVRIWGKIERAHYVGRAYGQLDPVTRRLILQGTGSIEHARGDA